MRAANVIAIALFAVLGSGTGTSHSAAPGTSDLAGRYDFNGTTSSGGRVTGQTLIAPRGDGYDVYWYFSDGSRNTGLGVRVDNVFGVVLGPDGSLFERMNVIAYKITGGELTGTRLSARNTDGRSGREILRGPADLNGRYEIVSSENPYGETLQSGFVEIEPRHEIYRVTWYTPERYFVGSGIRVGDVLVVGYARAESPGVAAYCVEGGMLQGQRLPLGEVWPGRETLWRAGPAEDLAADDCP